MSGLLLDTNVLSEIDREAATPQVGAYASEQPLDRLYVSSVSFAEVRLGIELVTDASRRAELNAWLTHKVRPAGGPPRLSMRRQSRTVHG